MLIAGPLNGRSCIGGAEPRADIDNRGLASSFRGRRTPGSYDLTNIRILDPIAPNGRASHVEPAAVTPQ